MINGLPLPKNDDMVKIAAAMEVLNLDEALQSTSLSSSKLEVQNFINSFITACAEINGTVRDHHLEALLQGQQTLSYEVLDILITTAEQVFAVTNYDYEEISNVRRALETAQLNLQSSKNPDDKEKAELQTTIRRQYDTTNESAFFIGITRANCFIAILDKCLPMVQETEERLIPLLNRTKHHLLKHLSIPLVTIINKFIYSEIYTRDYFDTYCLIKEKITNLKTLTPIFQADLIRDLNRCLSRKKSDANKLTGILNDLNQLLLLSKHTVLFLMTINDIETAIPICRAVDTLIAELYAIVKSIKNKRINHQSTLTCEYLIANKRFFEMMTTKRLSPNEAWLSQLAQLEPILALLHNKSEQLVAGSDDNAALLAKLADCVQASTHGPRVVTDKLDDLIIVLKMYAGFDPSSLPLSTVERVYRSTLSVLGELLKGKATLNQYHHQCVYTVMDRISKIISAHLKQLRANAANSPVALGALTQEYLTLCNNADRAVRYPLTCDYFSRNSDMLKSNSDQFLLEIIASYGLVSYKLDNSNLLFTQLLAHNARVNAFHGLLAFANQFAKRETIELLKNSFAKDLLGTVQVYCNCFFQNKIEEPFYFFAYLILIEKMEWLNEFFDDWWFVLSEQQFGKENLSIFNNNILFLSDLFLLVTEFCWKFDQKQLARSLQAKGLKFCETIMPMVAEQPLLTNNIIKLKKRLTLSGETYSPLEDKPWNLILNSLIRYFRELATEIPLQKGDERPTIIRKAAQLQKKLSAHKSTLSHLDLNQWLNDLLFMCKSLKAIDDEAQAGDYQLILNITNTLCKVLTNAPVLQYKNGAPVDVKKSIDREFQVVTRATQSAFNALTEDLKQLIAKKSTSQKLDTLEVSTAASTSDEPALSAQSTIVLVATLPSKDQHAQQVSDEKRHHQQTMQEITAQAKMQNKNALSDQANRQQAELATLKARNASKQESLTRELAKQLDAKKSKLARQYQLAKAAQETEHEKAIKDIHRQHQLAMQSAIDEHKNNMALLAQGQDQELTDLTTKHFLELQALKNEQHLVISKARQNAKAALEEQHQQTIAFNREIQAFELVRLSFKRRAIEGFRPIAKATLPQKLEKMLELFETHDIEAYVYGGWVRDFLLNVSHGRFSDYNLIVRAKPEKVRQILRVPLTSDPHNRKILRLGRITFRCSEWASLRHEPCDFTINSFIATTQGYIFDLRNNARDLGSHWLHAATNLDKAFAYQPELMLRMLQLSLQVDKRIDERDFAILIKHKLAITNIGLPLYFECLRALFINQHGIKHLAGIMSSDLVGAIFPGLKIHKDCLQALPNLNHFIEQRLLKMSRSSFEYGGEQILALFILISMLFNVQEDAAVAERCTYATNHFFAAYLRPVTEAQRLHTTQILNRIMLGFADEKGVQPGLYADYIDFESNEFAKQFYLAPVGPQLLAYEQARAARPSETVEDSLLQKYNGTPKL